MMLDLDELGRRNAEHFENGRILEADVLNAIDEIKRLWRENADLKDAAQDLYDVLREVEYVWDQTQELKVCSWCYEVEGKGHHDDCPIGNALDKYSEGGGDRR